MMKKSFISLILITLSIILMGCNKENEQEDPYAQSKNYASGIEYEVWKSDKSKHDIPHKYFKADFKDVEYFPIFNKICYTLDIFDSNYTNSEYVLISREKGSSLTESIITFPIARASYEGRDCMGVPDNKQIEIAVGKVDGEDINPTSYIEPMAILTFTDEHKYERKQLGESSLTSNTQSNLKFEDTPSIDFQFQFNDPEKAITKVIFEVYYEPFNIVVKQEEVDITEDMYEGNVITFDQYAIDGLAPNVEYELFVYITGNDGVDDFKNIEMASRIITTNTYPTYMITSLHDFYGMLLSVNIGETQSEVEYFLKNPGKVKFNDEPVTTSINVYDQSGNLVKGYPVTPGESSLMIDNQYLDDKYVLKLESDQGNTELARYILQYEYRVIGHLGHDDGVVTFNIEESNVDITNIKVEFKESNDATPFQTVNSLDLSQSQQMIHMKRDISNWSRLYITYYVTFNGLHGEETVKLHLMNMIN